MRKNVSSTKQLDIKGVGKMIKVTIWERIIKVTDKVTKIERDVVTHNHIEPNWVDGDKPKPLSPDFELQRSWSGYRWQKRCAYLDSNKIIL